jgi:hypothetical protein
MFALDVPVPLPSAPLLLARAGGDADVASLLRAIAARRGQRISPASRNCLVSPFWQQDASGRQLTPRLLGTGSQIIWVGAALPARITKAATGMLEWVGTLQPLTPLPTLAPGISYRFSVGSSITQTFRVASVADQQRLRSLLQPIERQRIAPQVQAQRKAAILLREGFADDALATLWQAGLVPPEAQGPFLCNGGSDL